MPTNRKDLTIRNSACAAWVPTPKAPSSSWRRVTAVYALCMASLVTLCMPVRANALTFTEHVFYVSQSGHIVELYYNGSWHRNDLTAATNGPTVITSQLTGFFDGYIPHVFYISPDAHVRELYRIGNVWHGNDLTAVTNARLAYSSALTGFFDGTFQHVFYIDNYAHVNEFWYNGTWNANDLTAETNGPVTFGPLTGFFDGQYQHVFYVSIMDSHVRELWNNGTWQGNDLTADTNGPGATCSALRFCLGSSYDGSVEHVFYLSSDGHVQELYHYNGWYGDDLTAITGGPLASNSPLSGLFDGSIDHVFYISPGDGHVRELYWNGAWHGNDLTADTNGPTTATTALTSLFDHALTKHVFYISYADSHVRELYYSNGRWLGNDLSAITKGPAALPYGITRFVTWQ